MVEMYQCFDLLCWIQFVVFQQVLQGGVILVVQGGLDFFVVFDFQVLVVCLGQLVIFQWFLVGGGELVEELFELQLQYCWFVILGLLCFVLGEQWFLGYGEQVQVGGEVVWGGFDCFVVELLEQQLVQVQCFVLVVVGIQCVGVGGLYQLVVGIGFEVQVELGQCLVVMFEQQVGVGEWQLQCVVLQCQVMLLC